ncbi:hypothetical protein LCGC14_1428710 [marine sediment metagenome]|uniref:Uncharacterized protein n=1 Tax=marine sediment metagenome TaxID=412755 RepID=A0A0F9JP96_9ZZZZ
MQGFNIAEMGHIVNILPPIDITGGVDADVFSMENYGHATIIIQIGVSSAAFTKIIVEECTAIDGTGATGIAHAIYKEETALGDTLGARVAALAAGTTPSANDTIFYVIEIDARELSADSPFIQLSLTNGVNSVIASAVAILSGSRYGGDQSATAIV